MIVSFLPHCGAICSFPPLADKLVGELKFDLADFVEKFVKVLRCWCSSGYEALQDVHQQ
jgi:hypothetical protein